MRLLFDISLGSIVTIKPQPVTINQKEKYYADEKNYIAYATHQVSFFCF
jgi:hypothetical protein